jgi:integrating conjugative element protein (TIGR03758 family)
MNSEMKDGFQAGSGVDPTTMKATLTMIGSGVIFLVFAYLMLGIFNAYRDERLSPGEAIWGGTKLLILLSLMLWVVF